MLSLLVAVTLSAAPAADAHPYTLAAPGLSYVGMNPETGDVFLDYFTQQIALKGTNLRVTTRSEVEALIGAERQRQLLGCSENATSCVAELAGGLGADAIITGSFAKLGTGLVVNLKIINAVNGDPIAIYSQRVATEDAALQYLESCAADFVGRVSKGDSANDSASKNVSSSQHIDTSYERPEVRSGPSKLWIVPAVIGGLALGFSGYEEYQAQRTNSRLIGRDQLILTDDQLSKVVEDGKQQQQYALIGAGVGAVSLGVMTVILLASGKEEPKPHITLAPTAGGAMVGFGGTLP